MAAGTLRPGALVLVALSLAGPLARAEEVEQELLIQVAVPSGVVLSRAIAEVDRAGESRPVRLADDGRTPGDTPTDGVYVGRDRGPVAPYAQVRLLLTEAGQSPGVAYEGLERLAGGEQELLGFVVARSPETGGLTAQRAAIALPGRGIEISESLPTVALFGWGMLAMGAVAWLLRSPGRERL